MMNAFAYRSPKTVEAAIAALGNQWGKTELLAGGTDLLDLLKGGLSTPETIVNVKAIASLRGITVVSATGETAASADAVEEFVEDEPRGPRRLLRRILGRRRHQSGNGIIVAGHEAEPAVAAGSSIRIGATTTLEEIAANAAVRKHLPALADAAAVIGGPQIRNTGTIGGNLCQRNRCWYFRNGLDPETKAENQYSAIFPIQGAMYVHPSTLAPSLIAYGAIAEVAGPAGKRNVAIDQLFQVASGAGRRETVLQPNEIVTSITIPVSDARSANYEVREKQSHDWPLVQASATVTLNGDRVEKASIVLGHVGPLPVRAREAEQLLAGKALSESTGADAGKAAAEGAKPSGENAYKVTLVQVAVKRALLAAAGNRYWMRS